MKTLQLFAAGGKFYFQFETIVALEILAGAIERDKSRHFDRQALLTLRQSGRADAALARLKRATKRRPPYAPAFHELGYLLMSLEKYDEAIEALRRLEIAPMNRSYRMRAQQQ